MGSPKERLRPGQHFADDSGTHLSGGDRKVWSLPAGEHPEEDDECQAVR